MAKTRKDCKEHREHFNMSTKNVLQPIDVNNTSMERSPVRKRARLEAPQKERWSLNNAVKLDEVYDFGVSVLDSDSDTLGDELSPQASPDLPACVESRSEKQAEVLTLEEWNGFTAHKAPTSSKCVDHFATLSDEVILHIFHFLPRRNLVNAASVCSRFYRLAKDESLWARFDAIGRVLVPGALGHILSRQVVILRVAQCEIQAPIMPAECRAAADNFQARLVYLDMGMAHIDTGSLITFFSKCRRLKKLSLENVQLNAHVLRVLARNTDIEVLNLAMADGVSVEGLAPLLKNCRKLRELNIAWTYLDINAINHICANLPASLDRLNISGCRKLLNDTNVADLVKSCPGLRELDLSDCTGLTGNAVQHIIQLRELNFLALSRCYLIPYRALLSLQKNESLLYLDVHGGYIELDELRKIQEVLGAHVQINKFKFSSVARPTVGARRSSIWNLRVRDP